MAGGGNMQGKFRQVTRHPWRLAMDQSVSTRTSADVPSAYPGCGPSKSARTKSKTPWLPGWHPVMSVVHAIGVRGCDVDRSTARTASADHCLRNGITPL